ncbi:zinc ribbon domain-containing protein [Natronosalvus rutilus]|uniref:Zinc-ribbon domain-containing protein n=1 Tax=Natronosalvus rutilus TaxID=2953753 RepID=A0A9E7NDD2_9EURY|nr:zinc ribbon domain-containing protein [Natronosalvus rutilus]UTF54828.1 zinc-ribbon domain-containing protein [Natronosalvus rutilus]
MKGQLSVVDQRGGKLAVDFSTEIYRDSGETQQILAETPDRVVSLGIEDATVSRKKQGVAPLVLTPEADHISVTNNGNANGVTVVDANGTSDIADGHMATLRSDATLEIGFRTTLRLEVERTAGPEVTVEGDVSGNVVLGDHVDRSTTVGDDNVLNRTDVGGDGAAEVGDDNVFSRSSIDTAETTSFCNEHNRPYDEVCPSCTQEAPATQTNVESQRHQTNTRERTSGTRAESGETKYCMHCGESIPDVAAVCPECGESQQL